MPAGDISKSRPTVSFVGDSGSGGKAGAVPAPPAGSASTKFLRADATWAVPAGGSGPQNNFTATSDPTVSNDTTQGYSVGSEWFNTVTNQYWKCFSATTGAADWIQRSLPTLNNVQTGQVLTIPLYYNWFFAQTLTLNGQTVLQGRMIDTQP